MLAFFLLATPAKTEPANSEPHSVRTLWSVPRFTILGLTRSSDGQIILLTEDLLKKQALFVGVNESGPGEKVLLPPVRADELRLAAGLGETLWIGGTTNVRRTMYNSPLSDAYLMKLDRTGQIAWESVFGKESERSIQGLAPLRNGDLMVVGRDDDSNWLARISGQGQIVWEKTFGRARIGSLSETISSVTVSDSNILVAALESLTTQDQVRTVLWRFDDAGNLLDLRKLREDLIRFPRSPWIIKLETLPNDGQFYLFSGWTDDAPSSRNDTSRQRPLRVTKLNDKNEILWDKDLPETVLRMVINGRDRTGLCYPNVTTLTNGDALVSCLEREATVVLKLESKTGAVTLAQHSPIKRRPNCNANEGRARFVIQGSEQALWSFGYSDGCTWLDALPIENLSAR